MSERHSASDGSAETAPTVTGATPRRGCGHGTAAQRLPAPVTEELEMHCVDPVELIQVQTGLLLVDLIADVSGAASSRCHAPPGHLVEALQRELLETMPADRLAYICADVVAAMLLAAEQLAERNAVVRGAARTALLVPAMFGAAPETKFEQDILSGFVGAVFGWRTQGDWFDYEGDDLTWQEAVDAGTEVILSATVRVHNAITAAVATRFGPEGAPGVLREYLAEMLWSEERPRR